MTALSPRFYSLPLEVICANRAPELACKGRKGKSVQPVLCIMGACPSAFAGMQAVVYCVDSEGEMDFWWIKPQGSDGTRLEWSTMNFNDRGPHKNNPGASASVYQPLADLFGQPRKKKDHVSFELCSVEGATRAMMLCRGVKLYMYSIWQEEWTSNPLAWTKHIQGKIVYQKDPATMEFFTLPYRIEDGVVAVGPPLTEEGPYGPAVMPSSTIKDMDDVQMQAG